MLTLFGLIILRKSTYDANVAEASSTGWSGGYKLGWESAKIDQQNRALAVTDRTFVDKQVDVLVDKFWARPEDRRDDEPRY